MQQLFCLDGLPKTTRSPVVAEKRADSRQSEAHHGQNCSFSRLKTTRRQKCCRKVPLVPLNHCLCKLDKLNIHSLRKHQKIGVRLTITPPMEHFSLAITLTLYTLGPSISQGFIVGQSRVIYPFRMSKKHPKADTQSGQRHQTHSARPGWPMSSDQVILHDATEIAEIGDIRVEVLDVVPITVPLKIINLDQFRLLGINSSVQYHHKFGH